MCFWVINTNRASTIIYRTNKTICFPIQYIVTTSVNNSPTNSVIKTNRSIAILRETAPLFKIIF